MGSIIKDNIKCSVCNKKGNYLYNGPIHGLYSDKKIKICPWCLADGSASKKYVSEGVGLSFNNPLEDSFNLKIKDIKFAGELIFRTPGAVDFLGKWPIHCLDFCVLKDKKKINQIKNLSEDIIDNLKKLEKDFPNIEKNKLIEVYIFECLECKEQKTVLSLNITSNQFKKIYNRNLVPKFKYHPNPLKTGSIVSKKIDCSSCGKKSNYSYEGPFYSQDTLSGICPYCIASGFAAKKYNGEFTTTYQCEVNNDVKKDELLHKTPGFNSAQEGHWLSHCDDFCEFLGEVSWNEIVRLGIEKEIEEDYKENYPEEFDFQDVKHSLEIGGCIAGYLFRCLHCKKYRLYVDAD